MSNGERFVRICPRHLLRLEAGPTRGGSVKGDALLCPRRHRVTNGKVVDTEKGIAVSAVDLEHGETAMLREELTMEEDKGPKAKTLERAKFADGGGLVLWLHLMTNRGKNGADPFRIRWTQETSDGKKGEKRKTVTGVVATAADEIAARKRFNASINEAVSAGWKRQEIIFGTKHLVLKAIPKPSKPAR